MGKVIGKDKEVG